MSRVWAFLFVFLFPFALSAQGEYVEEYPELSWVEESAEHSDAGHRSPASEPVIEEALDESSVQELVEIVEASS